MHTPHNYLTIFIIDLITVHVPKLSNFKSANSFASPRPIISKTNSNYHDKCQTDYLLS